jgi:hypothetical protein
MKSSQQPSRVVTSVNINNPYFEIAEQRDFASKKSEVLARIEYLEAHGVTDWLLLIYARQSSAGKRAGDSLGYLKKQYALVQLAESLWSVPTSRIELIRDCDLSGQIDIGQREGGRRVMERIAGGRVAAVVFDRVDRAFRDPEEARATLIPGDDGEQIASHSRLFGQFCAVYGTPAIASSRGSWRLFRFERTDDTEQFVTDAIEGGREAKNISHRTMPARRRSASQGRNAGGVVRIGYIGLPTLMPYPHTGARFLKPMILPYLPHAKVVALWQRAALKMGNESDVALLRYAREQTHLWETTRHLPESERLGADYRFHPFPRTLHDTSLASTAFNTMRCHVDPKTGLHQCSDSCHTEQSHYVWRSTATRHEPETGVITEYLELLPHEECQPVFPTANMIPCLLMHPFHLGDRFMHGDALTSTGLFKAVPRDEEGTKAHLEWARDVARTKLRLLGHLPYQRLVRGYDAVFRDTIGADELLEQYRLDGMMYDPVNREGDDADLSPDATWRLTEEEFWALVELRCPINLKSFRDSGYEPLALEPNPISERRRGRRQQPRRYTPFQKMFYCACHGFSGGCPNLRYRMVRGASQRDLDGIRCPGESGRDKTQGACTTIGANGIVYEVVNAAVQRILSGLRRDGTLEQQFGNYLSDAQRAAFSQQLATLNITLDEVAEESADVEERISKLNKTRDLPPQVRKARRARLDEELEDYDRRSRLIATEIAQVSSRLNQQVDARLIDDALAGADDWSAFFNDQNKTERGMAVVQQLANWIAVAGMNNSEVQEVLIVSDWKDRRDYYVTWRGKSHERFAFTDVQNAWLIKNYNRPNLRLVTVVKHFPGVPFLVIERHCRENLGLRRQDYRGKQARNLKAEWVKKYGTFARKNEGVLYAILDGHPLEAKRMLLVGRDGVPTRTIKIPTDVKNNLRVLVTTRCPDLP